MDADKVRRVAETWADKWFRPRPENRQAFIDTYMAFSSIRWTQYFPSGSSRAFKQAIALLHLEDFNKTYFDMNSCQMRRARVKRVVVDVLYEELDGALSGRTKAFDFELENALTGEHLALGVIKGMRRSRRRSIPAIFQNLRLRSQGALANLHEGVAAFASLFEATFLEAAVSDKAGRPRPFAEVVFERTQTPRMCRRYWAAMREFVNRLDSEVVYVLHGMLSMNPKAYMWLNGLDKETRHRRLQACRAYPLLMQIAFGYYGFHGDIWEQLSRVIDNGEPLAPMLADVFSASKGDIAFSQGLTWQRAGATYMHEYPTSDEKSCTPRLFADLRTTPAAYRPHSRAEWRLYRTAMAQLNTIAYVTGGKVEQYIPAFKAGWKQKMGEIEKQYGENAMDDVRDFVRFVNDELLSPFQECESHEDGASVLTRPLKEWGLKRLLNASAWWHRDLPAIEEKRQETFVKLGGVVENALSWPALVKDVWQDDKSDLEIVVLTTQAQLHVEGQRLNHCVGGYAHACAYFGHHIVSVRQGGKSLSTAELTLTVEEGRKARIRIQQHRGRSNSPPAVNAAQALTRFIRRVNRPEIIAYATTLAIQAEEREHLYQEQVRQVAAVRRRMAQETSLAILDAYSYLLPGTVRKEMGDIHRLERDSRTLLEEQGHG